MMSEIELIELIDGLEIKDYKIHLASWNGTNHPLDIFVSDKKAWQRWNEYRGQRNDFNRKYIFSLIQFYPERDTWLFGGLFRVKKRYSDRYEVELYRKYLPLIGRLKVHYKRSGRAKSVLPENQFKHMIVAELLRAPYTGEVFPGYEDINHSFNSMEAIFKQQKHDWKSALSNVKGVYLISDVSNGKRYVGSAYGETGVWSRWSCYIGTGHGHNDEFGKIIDVQGIEYARKYFIFSLLEYRSMKTDDHIIIKRESFWKEVLLTRGAYGYNKN